ncbi:MAG: YicC family protein [Candidatus Eisenbacteria bacterium]|uniref:YicC family protein n=1 Tax=Eiseniibacteriota bacterium TaxID=2212470 RepID=A0A9D6L814_UNCEI|nr:YicC family protein [Candidatus Eisenbacteria bacterium]
MIRSMTGYGSADLDRDGQRLNAEIRSVNHRFCEVSVRAPKLVGLFEDQIRQLIADRFSRGKFNLTITWSGAGDSGEVLKVNEIVTDRYVALLDQLRKRYKLDSGLDVRTLASLPDVFTWEHTALSDEETWALLKQVIEQACANMNAMKAREGESLARDLEGRLSLIATQLERIAVRAPLRPVEAKEKLATRLKALMGDVEMDPTRIAQEVAMMADRLDCTEECVRLAAHLDQFKHLIDGTELAGRKLNFLLQEMNREANTIGSKANDVEMAHAVIVVKEELERLREQVQNVE